MKKKRLYIVISILLFNWIQFGSNTKPRCDLSIVELKIMPMVAYTEQLTQIHMIIKNIGKQIAPKSWAQIKVGNEYTPLRFTVPKLKINESHTLIRHKRFTKIGKYRIVGFVDDNQKLGESNENNNKKTITINVNKYCSDLIVTKLSAHPPSPFTDKISEIRMTIKNIGEQTSPDTFVQIRIGNEYTPLGFTLPELKKNESHTVSRYKRFTKPGKYRIIGFADYGLTIDECNENNNKQSLTIHVKKYGPDLTVEKLSLHPATPYTEKFTEIRMILKNIGLETAPKSWAQIKVGNEYTPLRFTVPELKVNESYTVSRFKRFTVPGSYKIIGRADDDSKISELKEGNNHKEIETVVNKYGSDLIVEHILISPKNPTTGTVGVISMKVKNIGMKPASKFFAAIKLGNEYTPLEFVIPELPPNGSAIVKRHRNFFAPGEYIITGIADSRSDIDELNENNNTKQTKTTVKTISPDLIVENIIQSPLQPTTGTTAEIYMTLTNIGQKNASQFSAAIKIGDEKNPKIFQIPQLDVNGKITLKRIYTYTKPGTYQIYGITDYQNSIEESNENNNQKTYISKVISSSLLLSKKKKK